MRRAKNYLRAAKGVVRGLQAGYKALKNGGANKTTLNIHLKHIRNTEAEVNRNKQKISVLKEIQELEKRYRAEVQKVKELHASYKRAKNQNRTNIMNRNMRQIRHHMSIYKGLESRIKMREKRLNSASPSRAQSLLRQAARSI
jgi:vacuolar-type H+-ATPase subunit I/STV1